MFESPSKDVLNYPNNITCSPSGVLVLCEDEDGNVERLCSLSRQGELALFAENKVFLDRERIAIAGDFRKQEW